MSQVLNGALWAPHTYACIATTCQASLKQECSLVLMNSPSELMAWTSGQAIWTLGALDADGKRTCSECVTQQVTR